MAASETGFSRPRDIGTRRRCPPYLAREGARPQRCPAGSRLGGAATIPRSLCWAAPLPRPPPSNAAAASSNEALRIDLRGVPVQRRRDSGG